MEETRMKKMVQLSIVSLLLFLTTTMVSAHTDLSTTNPENGSEITEPLSEITLTYSGQIEEGSVFDLQNEQGETISVESFSITDGVLTGTLAAPLENGAYTVNWNSISEDGHPLNGTFAFTVAVPEQDPVTTEVQETEDAESTEEVEEPAEQATEDSSDETVVAATATETDAGSSPLIWVIVGLVIVLVAASLLMVTKRKRA